MALVNVFAEKVDESTLKLEAIRWLNHNKTALNSSGLWESVFWMERSASKVGNELFKAVQYLENSESPNAELLTSGRVHLAKVKPYYDAISQDGICPDSVPTHRKEKPGLKHRPVRRDTSAGSHRRVQRSAQRASNLKRATSAVGTAIKPKPRQRRFEIPVEIVEHARTPSPAPPRPGWAAAG